MAKIPYVFKAIPEEFMTDDFLEDTLMMKIVREILSRIRFEPHIDEFICNRKKVSLRLDAFEFTFGRLALAKKLNAKEDAIRSRVNKLYSLKFIERYPQKKGKKTTSSSTSSSAVRSTGSSDKFSTSSYSVCRLCVENFKQLKQQINHQQLYEENHQQFHQQFSQKFPHKEEALASKEVKNKNENENVESLQVVGGVQVTSKNLTIAYIIGPDGKPIPPPSDVESPSSSLSFFSRDPPAELSSIPGLTDIQIQQTLDLYDDEHIKLVVAYTLSKNPDNLASYFLNCRKYQFSHLTEQAEKNKKALRAAGSKYGFKVSFEKQYAVFPGGEKIEVGLSKERFNEEVQKIAEKYQTLAEIT